jgi:hypothetical protein
MFCNIGHSNKKVHVVYDIGGKYQAVGLEGATWLRLTNISMSILCIYEENLIGGGGSAPPALPPCPECNQF